MKKYQKIKLVLFFFLLTMTVIFAIMFPRLTLPFGLAYIIFLMVKPFTLKLIIGSKSKRVFYFSLMIMCVGVALLPLFVALYNIDLNFANLTAQLPEVQKILQDKFFVFKVQVYEKYGYRINVDPVNWLVTKIETEGSYFLSQFPSYISTLFEWLLLVPMFMYFFFLESSKFKTRLMESIPNPIFEKTYVLFSQFNTKFGEYIIAKFVEATILGSLVTIGLLLIGFPYPFILGFIAGVTNILPYIGPVLGIVPAFFIALLSKDPNASMLGMVIIFMGANLIDMILVFPLLVSKIVNLHPIVVVVSIIVGSQLGGIIGMIVIIPFIAFFKLLFKEIYKDLSVHL